MTAAERTLWRRLEAQASATKEQAACEVRELEQLLGQVEYQLRAAKHRLEIATRQAERVSAERDDAEGGTR